MSDTAGWLKSLLPFVVMCFGGFMALLDIQIVASSLQYIGGGLSAAQDDISWVQTAYLIAEIVVIPLSGLLTRVFSTRWLFAASAAGFTVTSLLCALAWTWVRGPWIDARNSASRGNGLHRTDLGHVSMPGRGLRPPR